MNYLNSQFNLGLYENPFNEAQQARVMAIFDGLATALFQVIMTHGTNAKAVHNSMIKLEQIEFLLKSSKTGYFYDQKGPMMCDCFGWPFVARLFYFGQTDVSKQDAGYDLQNLPDKFPFTYKWYRTIKDNEKLKKEQTPERAFHLWAEELMTLPIGKKPPLRLPMKL